MVKVYCDECGGRGVDLAYWTCFDCDGNGFIETPDPPTWFKGLPMKPGTYWINGRMMARMPDDCLVNLAMWEYFRDQWFYGPIPDAPQSDVVETFEQLASACGDAWKGVDAEAFVNELRCRDEDSDQ